MKKNVAGQKIGAQLISNTDGSPVTTGTTTIYITGDAGTQAVGSVGAGACTHKGNGYWSYAPDIAETNYDLIAFTFVNAAACNASVQVETSYPQTGDSFGRIGAAGAGLTTLGDARIANLDAAVSSRSVYAGGAVASVTAGVTVSTNNDKTGYGLSAAAIQAIWDALTSALTTVGSIGKKLADWVIGTAQTGDSFARIGTSGAGLTAITGVSLAASQHVIVDSGTVTTLSNLPAIPDNWITAVGITAAALNGKGDWNIGKTGYSLTQAFPTNFASMSLTAAGLMTLAPVTHTGAIIPTVSAVTGLTASNLDATVSSRSTYSGGAVASVTGAVGSVTGLVAANLDVAVSTRAMPSDVPTAAKNGAGVKAVLGIATAQAGASSSLTLDVNALEDTDYYTGLKVYITSGTGAGQSRNVVKSGKNLVPYSEVFSNWTAQSDAIVVSDNFTTSPFGTLTAAHITENNTVAYHRIGLSLSSDSNVQRRFGVYAKSAERTWARGWSWAGGNTTQQTFNLTTGVATGTQNPTMTNAGSGWWLCEFDVSAGNANNVVFGPSDGVVSGTNTYQGISGNGIYVAAGTRNYGASLLPYFHTVGTPAVGVSTDTTWTTMPDATSVYSLGANENLVADIAAAVPTAVQNAAAVRTNLAVELTEIMLLPDVVAIAAEVLTAATTTPIAANIKKVKDQTITGVGTQATPWGPV